MSRFGIWATSGASCASQGENRKARCEAPLAMQSPKKNGHYRLSDQ